MSKQIELSRRRVIGGVATIGVAAAAAGAGTYAAISNTESSSGNSVTAGTLDLVLDPDGSSSATSISVGNIVPGDSGYLAIELDNAGDVNGNLTSVSVTINSDSENGPAEFDNGDGDGELDDNLNVDLLVENGTFGGTEGPNSGSEYTPNSGTTYASDTLANVAGTQTPSSAPTLNPSETKYFVLNYTLPSGTGNEIQGDSVDFTIDITLEQA